MVGHALVGGDGTLHHLVNSAVGLNAPVGVIPSGRANDFARGLGVPLDPLEACLALRSPRFVEVDLVEAGAQRHVADHGDAAAPPGLVDGCRHLRREMVVRLHAVEITIDLLDDGVGLRGAQDDARIRQLGPLAVDEGAQIINISMGSYGNSVIVSDAVQYAEDNGVIIVAAVWVAVRFELGSIDPDQLAEQIRSTNSLGPCAST